MMKLLRYLGQYKKFTLIGPVFKLIEAIFELIVPIVTARMIDRGVRTGDIGYVWTMGGILILLGVVGLCSALICQKCGSIASQGFGTNLRNAMYCHINKFSHKEIDKFGTPSLITRMTSDINQLQFAVAMLVRLVIRAPFLAIGAIIMAMMIDLRLAIVFVVATPLIGLVLYLVMSRSVPHFKQIQKKLDRISHLSRESLSGVRVVRAFSNQEQEEQRFVAASEDQTKTAIQVGKLSALLNPLTYTIMNLAVVAIVWFGGFRVESGGMTQGEVIAFVNYMSQTLLALIVVANLVITFTKAFASANRVQEVLDTKTSVSEENQEAITIPNDSHAPKISFEGVCFSYTGKSVSEQEQDALKKLSVEIESGETVGIIGGTGAGKSTLVQLIPRFYDATQGVVKVDGVDVREYSFDQLRAQIGMVPQEAVLFSGTIRSNLLWGQEDATEEQLNRALRIAQAQSFVSQLPDGLDAPVHQGGKNFSGGQRQRLTIARALVGQPKILILDDSSSALDFATDAALRRAIRQETKDMTVIIVSQRAGSIKQADKIIVLDNGAVAGIGTHTELLNECEVYREICLSQMSEEEVNRV
ncbi:MAG: ABC transporter ATP-binding protein [Clostridiales bacterium]|jgi:ATP-binding cassette subfamily B multidrug efflux pump|nr:ABC transporter ATP-binding protein [Clostridiales bacterium]